VPGQTPSRAISKKTSEILAWVTETHARLAFELGQEAERELARQRGVVERYVERVKGQP
jgi:hypothetical protein